MPDFLANAKLVVSPAGSIVPMSFVCVDGIQGNNFCRQATVITPTTCDFPIAISQTGFDLGPNLVTALTGGVSGDPNEAGGPNSQIQLFTSGDVCPLRLGVGGATPGAALTNDNAGLGVMIAPFTASRWRGAIALQTGAAGEIIEVYMIPGHA